MCMCVHVLTAHKCFRMPEKYSATTSTHVKGYAEVQYFSLIKMFISGGFKEHLKFTSSNVDLF